jgi:hypothetical protein
VLEAPTQPSAPCSAEPVPETLITNYQASGKP